MFGRDSGDSHEICPYDNTHVILAKSFNSHLVRCRKNNQHLKKIACKFDRTHMILKPELAHHHKVCPSRILLNREMQAKAKSAHTLTGAIQGPEIRRAYVEDTEEEDWDAGPRHVATNALFYNKKNYTEEAEEEESYPVRRPQHTPSPHDAATGAASAYAAGPSSSSSSIATAVPGEESFRRAPMMPSKVAQMSRGIAPVRPHSSMIYQYSVQQAGRGRATTVNKNVSMVRPLSTNPRPGNPSQASAPHLGRGIARYATNVPGVGGAPLPPSMGYGRGAPRQENLRTQPQSMRSADFRQFEDASAALTEDTRSVVSLDSQSTYSTMQPSVDLESEFSGLRVSEYQGSALSDVQPSDSASVYSATQPSLDGMSGISSTQSSQAGFFDRSLFEQQLRSQPDLQPAAAGHTQTHPEDVQAQSGGTSLAGDSSSQLDLDSELRALLLAEQQENERQMKELKRQQEARHRQLLQLMAQRQHPTSQPLQQQQAVEQREPPPPPGFAPRPTATTSHISESRREKKANLSNMNPECLTKEKRKVEKKLKQIASLEKKGAEGVALTDEENAKLEKKAGLLKELERISALL